MISVDPLLFQESRRNTSNLIITKYLFLLFSKNYTIKSHLKKHSFVLLGNDHEVEFHEIKTQLFQEIEFLIMRLIFNLFMRSNLFINI
jgi:hypothetical protein